MKWKGHQYLHKALTLTHVLPRKGNPGSVAGIWLLDSVTVIEAGEEIPTPTAGLWPASSLRLHNLDPMAGTGTLTFWSPRTLIFEAEWAEYS